MTDELNANLIQTSGLFKVSTNEIKELFKVDNIGEGKSLASYKEKYGATASFLEALHTSQERGISMQDFKDIQERRRFFGNNHLIEPPATTILEYIMVALDDFTLKILIVAAIFSLIINISSEGLAKGWYEGTAILIAICIIVSITVVNDYLQDKQFRKLFKKSAKRIIKVVRDAKLVEVDVQELIVGDIALVETGLIFPADMILLSKDDKFLTDESQMTGESHLLSKNIVGECQPKESPFLVSGTKIMDGTGYGLVAAVGINSQLGMLRANMQTAAEPTPLQLKLEDLANTIGIIGGGGATLTFIGCVLGLVISVLSSEDGQLMSMFVLNKILSFVILAITIVVMAVPEGLPMAVTIALAYSVNEMKKKNNLVREMAACETMGNATDICSDKTGTLTQNNMTVIDVWVSGNITDVARGIPEKLLNDPNCKEVSIAVAINSSATPDFSIDLKLQTGNRTEMALLDFAKKMNCDYNDYRPSPKIVKVKPFSSIRKKMSTIITEDDGSLSLLVKGAPEIILKSCTTYVGNNGTAPVTEEWIADLQKNVLGFIGAKRARAIGVCKVSLPSDIDLESETVFEDHEHDMEFCAVFGIMDPVRFDVPEAVLTCKKAGVTTRMVTGDNVLIAAAIAKQCHILPKDYRGTKDDYVVMEGREFREACGGLGWKTIEIKGKPEKQPYVNNMAKFTQIAQKLKVLGRSLPEDKLLLVTGLQALGKVVAVTGDGTNDAAALKKSNVGFAMGKTGTDVCKDASSIVLLDDNFSSIVVAIKFGRNVFEAIRKFVQYQLTVNFIAMAISIICGFVIRESPLNAIQMLWLNMIMDSFAALALATEPPSDSLLTRPPTRKKEKIISETMWRTVTVQIMLQLIVHFIIIFKGHEFLGVPSSIGLEHWTAEKGVHYTFFFNCFVFLQTFNFINCRTLKKEQINPFKNICSNPLFWVVICITVTGQIIFVQYFGRPVRSSPLPLWMHEISVAVGSLSLVFGFIRKLVPDKILPIPNFLKEKETVTAEDVKNGIVSSTRRSWKNKSQIIRAQG